MISKQAKNPEALIGVIAGSLWRSISKTAICPQGLSGLASLFHSFLTIVLGTSSLVLLSGFLFGGFGKKRASQTGE
jgi:hypothetical protein